MQYAKIGLLSDAVTVEEQAADFISKLQALVDADGSEARKVEVTRALDLARAARKAANDFELMRFVKQVAPKLFKQYCAPYTFFAHDSEAGARIAPNFLSLGSAVRVRFGVLQIEAGDVLDVPPKGIDYLYATDGQGSTSLLDAHTRKEIWACP